MIVRDLLTRLGLKVDDDGFKKADRSIGGAANALRGLALTFGAVLGAQGFGKLIGLASDASETLNVISAAFGKNADDVTAWASSLSSEVGRSEFKLREMAGTLGAVLNPQMEGNVDAAAEMSKRLAGLAVDLGSFFNVADDDALIALRSGITGETEPLKRFGIILTEANLAQVALNKGIRTSVKDMTIAEKTALRYEAILELSAAAQGDAARTSEGFANSSKALKDALRDVGTRIGLAALPAVEKLTVRARDLVRGFQELVKNGKLAESILALLGAAAVVFGAKALLAFAGPLATIALWAAGFALLALLLEDVIVLFTGGESAVGRFIDEIFGLGAADQFVQNHRAGVDIMAEAWRDAEGDLLQFGLSLGGIQADLPAFGDTLRGLGASVVDLGNTIVESLVGSLTAVLEAAGNLSILPPALRARAKAAAGTLKAATQQFRLENQSRAAGRGTGGAGQFTESRFEGRRREARNAFLARQAAKQNRRLAREAGAEVEGLTFERSQRATGRGIGAGVEDVRFGVARTEGVGATSSVVQDNRTEIVIDAAGQSPEQLRAQLEQMIAKRDAANRRAANAAVKRTAAGG